MSNSHKKNPIGGNCGGSDKKSKRFANRKIRRINKVLLEKFEDEYEPKNEKEVANDYTFQKDGKHYFGKIKTMCNWFRNWSLDDIKKSMRK